ncbi:MAG: hypothetical protein WCI74_17565 [Actinomycetes bacterium]
MTAGVGFSEAMVGQWRRVGESADRPFRFDVAVMTEKMLTPFGVVNGDLHGTVTAEGLASGTPIAGTIEISPLELHRLRYTFTTIADDGREYRFDGWKTIRGVRLLRAMTTLPITVYGPDGGVIGTGLTRFPLQTAAAWLGSFRVKRAEAVEESIGSRA